VNVESPIKENYERGSVDMGLEWQCFGSK